MSVRHSNRYLALLCVAAAALPACNGSGESSAPLSLTSGSPLGSQRDVGLGSRMSSKTTSQGLLYTSDGSNGTVYVYSYPTGKLVGTLNDLNASAAGECADSAGDVFITTSDQSGASTIYEYAHGGTSPVASLSDRGLASGCSVDSRSGNLAVVNSSDPGNPYRRLGPSLAIYARARGKPRMYYDRNAEVGDFLFCGYDDKGNLYLSALDEYTAPRLLLRLAKGRSTFDIIDVDTRLYGGPSVQWDGKYVTVSSVPEGGARGPLSVYRLRISGSAAKVVGTTKLSVLKNRYRGQSWIQGGTIIGIDRPERSYESVSLWPYPKGGKPRQSIQKIASELEGVAVSLGSFH